MIDSTPISLVGQGRIRVSITKNDFPLLNRGADYFPDVLRPVRQVKKQFRRRRDGLLADFEKNLPDELPERCCAGLSGYYTGIAAGGEMTFQSLELSGLTGPVTALEGDETNHEYGTMKSAISKT